MLKSDALPPASEQDEFRRELCERICDQDSNWSNTRSSQDCEQRDFLNHPILAKYVAWIRYWRLRPSVRLSERVTGIEWVRLPRWDHYYNLQEMADYGR